MAVSRTTKKREEAEKEVDLSGIPKFVQEVTIVDIEGFDKRPCRDPHVDNTNKIGKFEILSMDRVGNNRYRLPFQL